MRNSVLSGILLVIAITCGLLFAGCSEETEQKEDTTAIAQIEFEKGLELASAGDYEQGLIHFQEAIKHDPAHHRAWCGLGSASRELKKFDEAVEYSVKAIELKPDYVVCHDNLGLAYAYRGDFGEAIKSFNRAIELDPGYADAHFNLGLLYYEKLDNPELAVESFTKFIELSDKPDKVNEAKQLIEQLQGEDQQ